METTRLVAIDLNGRRAVPRTEAMTEHELARRFTADQQVELAHGAPVVLVLNTRHGCVLTEYRRAAH